MQHHNETQHNKKMQHLVKQNSMLGVVLGITMFSVAFYTLTVILLNVTRLRVVAPFKRRLPRIHDFTKRNSKNKNKKETKFFAKKLLFLRH